MAVIVGLVGGVASGKSFVAEQFRRLGAAVLEADRVGHEILEEPDVRAALRARWGPAVFDAAGQVDRRQVAARVFAADGTAERKFLEQLTHPRIGQRLRQRAAELAESGSALVVLDAALLLEAGWDRWCDHVIFVEASSQERLKRATQRGWKAADFAAREAAQESLDKKRKRADWVIDNGRSPEQTFAQVQQFWQTLN